MARATQPCIVVAAHHDDLPMIRAAFERIALSAQFHFVADGKQLFNYLEGGGKYLSSGRGIVPDETHRP